MLQIPAKCDSIAAKSLGLGMSKLNELEKRLTAAIANLPQWDGLTAENAVLKAELTSLKAQRKKDVAELDALLAKLKPMLEDAGNA